MIVTLTTDLGDTGNTLARLKALLTSSLADVEIADITHHITPHSQRQAAHVLGKAWKHFPGGTVHLAPVAVFVGGDPLMMLAEHKGHYFIAPDNGLLPLMLGRNIEAATRKLHRYNKPYNFKTWIQDAAAAIAGLQTGQLLPVAGSSLREMRLIQPPERTHSGIECRIVYADTYGNLVLNLSREDFEYMSVPNPFLIATLGANPITTISHHYSDVPHGHALARFNSAGFMEIAVNHGSARELFGLQEVTEADLPLHPVRIDLL